MNNILGFPSSTSDLCNLSGELGDFRNRWHRRPEWQQRIVCGLDDGQERSKAVELGCVARHRKYVAAVVERQNLTGQWKVSGMAAFASGSVGRGDMNCSRRSGVDEDESKRESSGRLRLLQGSLRHPPKR